MQYRQLGKSGIKVSEVGFGSWAIGGNQWGPTDRKESVEALQKALDLGINFIDTADVYGDGVSEEIVAEAIKGKRDQVVISTKGGLLGHHRDPNREPFNDTPEKVITACENSLKRLGTDYIDVYFCHLWWDKEVETEAFMVAFEKLKKDGKVRVTGVSAEDINYIKHFNREGNLDVVQADYSILNRNPEKEVLPYLKENGIGVVVKGPLKMGILTGKFANQTNFANDDIRSNWPNEAWFKESVEKVEKLRTATEGDSDSLTRLALRFVLANDAVSVAIPGAKTPAQVEENASASVRPLLTDNERKSIEDLTGASVA